MASGKVLHSNMFAIASNPKYDQYQRGFTSIVSLIKKPTDTTVLAVAGIISEYQQLANENNRHPTRKFRDSNYAHLIDITFGVLILKTCS